VVAQKVVHQQAGPVDPGYAAFVKEDVLRSDVAAQVALRDGVGSDPVPIEGVGGFFWIILPSDGIQSRIHRAALHSITPTIKAVAVNFAIVAVPEVGALILPGRIVYVETQSSPCGSILLNGLLST
jgi:hypothetical protein